MNIKLSIQRLLLIGLFAFPINAIYAQDKTTTPDEFIMVKQLKTTSVKNQSSTGTCWDFATISFLESEIIRKGKGEVDLSEMYIVRHTYPSKAQQYVRLHGNKTFGEGGQAHDVINVMAENGLVPLETYPGLNYGESKHNHGELFTILKGAVEAIIKNNEKKLTTVWLDAVNAILDVYLGKDPVNFNYKGKDYTPKTFCKDMGLNPNDYVELTSFSHHPFYKKFVLEIPDNWSCGEYYNIPMNELINVMDNSLENGYTVAWDGDVSETEFSQSHGYAILPNEDMILNQDNRQLEFDNYETTDDHLMHMVGLAKDKNDKKYYYTKNSWSTIGKYDGYLYISQPYIYMKTIAILVNKEAIPKDILKKLEIK